MQRFVKRCTALLFSALLLAGCGSMQINYNKQPLALSPSDTFAILPFTNMTETPQADERAADITAELMRTRGMHVVSYPLRPLKPTLIPGGRTPLSRQSALAWARNQHARYAVIGGVTEWNYKVGLDGEPAVGVTLEIVDVNTDYVVWNAVGSKIGGSRTALSTVAQDLISNMLKHIR